MTSAAARAMLKLPGCDEGCTLRAIEIENRTELSCKIEVNLQSQVAIVSIFFSITAQVSITILGCASRDRPSRKSHKILRENDKEMLKIVIILLLNTS